MPTVVNAIYQRLRNYPQYLQCITDITYLPSECVDTTRLVGATYGTNLTLYSIKDHIGEVRKSCMSVSDKYSGVPTSKESKLLMYPYTYAQITSYTGHTMDIKLEHLTGKGITVESLGHLSPNPRVAYIVNNYNGDTSLDNSLIVGDFPSLPVANSTYETYMARSKATNLTNLGLGLATTVGGAVLAPMTGGASLALSGIGASGLIANTLTKKHEMQHSPNALQTQQGGNGFNIANGIKGFDIKIKTIKPEYRKILENYFHMYGYKVNTLKVPNLDTRKQFNYVKTVGANITGDIHTAHLEELKSIFDNGVTVWHTTTGMLNYSVENEVK